MTKPPARSNRQRYEENRARRDPNYTPRAAAPPASAPPAEVVREAEALSLDEPVSPRSENPLVRWRLPLITLAVFLLLVLIVTVANALGGSTGGDSVIFRAGESSVTVNDTAVTLKAAPLDVEGVLTGPVTAAMALGFTVSWDSATQSAIVERENERLTFTVDSAAATKNGEALTLSQAAFFEGDSLFVPLTDLLEACGYTATYDATTGQLTATAPSRD